MTDQQLRNQGFATETYEVTLDDYHPGEYTDFAHWAEGINEHLRTYKAQPDPGPFADLPFVQAKLIEADWDNDDGDHDKVDRWEIKGTANQLRSLYQELLARLATPAWHWYGMGGDDHAFDYWPNTMGLAMELRNRLLEIAEAEPDGPLKDPYHTTYIAEDLNRVYWLCRERWERDQARTVPGHEYSGTFDDFLPADDFGDRP